MASYYHELLAKESAHLERSQKRQQERQRQQMLDALDMDEVEFREIQELLTKPQRSRISMPRPSQSTGPPPA